VAVDASRQSGRWAIIGAAGTIGRNVGPELDRRGVPFRVIGRRREALERAFGSLPHAEIAPADLRNGDGVDEALRFVDTAIYAVGVPYTQFDQHPVLMQKAVVACIAAGVRRLAVVSNVYVYGIPQSTPVTETHPLAAHTFKGKMRIAQERVAFEADRSGRLRVGIVRPADFYGPHAEQSYAHTLFESALSGKPANLLAPADTPHQLSYAPDIAQILVALAARDDAYGEAYNIGGPTTTMRAFVEEIYAQVGAPFRARHINKFMLHLIGLFDPFMREMVEMHYLQERPVIASDAKLRALLGDVPETPLRAGIVATLASMRSAAQASGAEIDR
jgi:nucleoside-diphosphate-sugar epimerase